MRHVLHRLAGCGVLDTVNLICRHFMGLSSSRMSDIEPVVLAPKGRHTATVIFLHGLGDTGHGWAGGFDEIKEDHIKYVFPTANTIPVTLNGGMPMPSWFDIFTLNFGGQEDTDGIMKASRKLVSLVEKEEKNGIPSERIVIGGFSQGGAVALHAGIFCGKKLGGLLALSSWMPLHDQALKVKTPPEFSILQCHGQVDPIVRFTYGKMTADLLSDKMKCPKHVFKIYPNLAHSSSISEMQDVKAFLADVLSSST